MCLLDRPVGKVSSRPFQVTTPVHHPNHRRPPSWSALPALRLLRWWRHGTPRLQDLLWSNPLSHLHKSSSRVTLSPLRFFCESLVSQAAHQGVACVVGSRSRYHNVSTISNMEVSNPREQYKGQCQRYSNDRLCLYT